MIEIYTDGATSGNGTEHSKGGFAYVVYEDNKIIDAYAKKEENTTNNICELKAIIAAMAKYGTKNPIVYSDSSYAINSLTKWRYGWKLNNWCKSTGEKIKNLELIQAFDELENMGLSIQLKKVSGHVGIPGNELADKLATGNIVINEIINTY